jgi:DNA-binding CsgD family transcriptional regulator
MLTGSALDDLATTISRICRSGLEPAELRTALLPRLQRAVPTDALWWANADPATLLFTQAYREELPATSGPYFVENEFLDDDVNKWTDLAQHHDGAGTLMQATDSTPTISARYRDIFEPLGLADELRAVLRVQGACWGYLCMHRATSRFPFSQDETAFVRRVAPYIAEGIRMSLLLQACEGPAPAGAPGLVMIGADGAVTGVNQAAAGWIDALGGHAQASDLPIEITLLASLLRRQAPSEPVLPRLRVRTPSGRWATLHASWMSYPPEDTIAVIIENATPNEVAPMIMMAHGLTDRERMITALICRGLSTRLIADRLHLTADTVQDHVKSIFSKTGVHSRGELVATILQRDYLPRMAAGDPIDPSGAFAPPPTR